jgi:hypothetical protein
MQKFSTLTVAALLATCVTVMAGTGAMAVTTQVNFASNDADTGLQTKTYGGVITLDAFTVSRTDWNNGGGITYLTAGTTLFEHNLAPDDIGVGICNPQDRLAGISGNACLGSDGSGGAAGVRNEISNNNDYIDVMRISVAAGWQFAALGISSLDDSSAPGSNNDDTFRLFASNTANPDLTGMSANLTGDQHSQNTKSPTYDISALAGSKYLYLTGAAGTLPGSAGSVDDFLLKSVSFEEAGGPRSNEVPEPGALALLGVGLLGLGFIHRRRHSAR